jgi:UDP-glucose:(glucosyl)LPS alpha-1,2-glucosyltransferase
MNNENLIFNYNKELFGGTECMAKNFHERVLPYAKNFYKYNCLILPGQIENINYYIFDEKETIVWLHNTPEQFNSEINFIFYKKEFLERIKYVVVVSEFAKNNLVLTTGIDPSKVVVIYNAIDPVQNDIKRFKNVEMVEIVHSSAQERGSFILMLALKYCKEDFRLSIYNQLNPDLQNFNNQFTNIAKDSRIYFYGRTSKKVLMKNLSQSHMYVYPSIFEETFCLSQVEALSANCLTIYNDLGSLKEVSLGFGISYNGTTNMEKHAKQLAKLIDDNVKKIKENIFNPKDQSVSINNKFSWNNFENSWLKFNEII